MSLKLILFGCLGGALPDFIRLIQNRYKVELPDYVRSMSFFIGFTLLVALGGFTAWVGGAKTPVEALAYGFSAPEIISKLISKRPIHLGRPTFARTLFRFWAF